jgi:hypothetical protein
MLPPADKYVASFAVGDMVDKRQCILDQRVMVYLSCFRETDRPALPSPTQSIQGWPATGTYAGTNCFPRLIRNSAARTSEDRQSPWGDADGRIHEMGKAG